MKNIIIKTAAVNAILTVVYIVVVALFLFYAPKVFGSSGKPDTVLAPIVMLSLFVFSAALTGTLIFGRPILWYLDGKKSEAISLFAYTLAIFLAIMIFAFIALYFIA